MADVPLIVYNAFVDDLANGHHVLSTDQMAVALTDRAPVPASDAIFNTTTAPPPAATNGYPAGGNNTATVSATTVGGVFTLVLQDQVFAATAGGIGPFRYAILYNKTAGNRLIGSYDYGLEVLLGYLEQFTVDFSSDKGVFSVLVGPPVP